MNALAMLRRLWTDPRDQYMSAAWLEKCRSPKYQPPIERAKGQLRSAWSAVRETFRCWTRRAA